MLYERRVYTLHPGRVAEFVRVYRERVLPVIGRHADLAGAFTRESGDINAVEFLWSYADHDQRARRRAALAADPEWAPAVALILPMIAAQETWFLRAADLGRPA